MCTFLYDFYIVYNQYLVRLLDGGKSVSYGNLFCRGLTEKLPSGLGVHFPDLHLQLPHPK